MEVHILEKRRERVRKLISIATQDQNPVKIWQGYAVLNEVNKRLSGAYQLEGRFSNLYK